MSSTDATTHDAQDLICALKKSSPASSLVALGNAHKESLIPLADIFGIETSSEVPPGVPVKGAYQEKLQQVNQLKTRFKIHIN